MRHPPLESRQAARIMPLFVTVNNVTRHNVTQLIDIRTYRIRTYQHSDISSFGHINIRTYQHTKPCNTVIIFSFLFIKGGPWLMRLYTTPTSILTLVTWVQPTQAGLRPNPHVGWPSGLRPTAKPNPTVCSLACRWWADQESFSIESGSLLDSKA